jgi:signal transduction histidine kinase
LASLAVSIGHIFNPFKRGESHGQRGVGLGLAIASQAAMLLGARLTVESQMGVGSKFGLSLLEDRKLEHGLPSKEVMA